MSTRAEQRAEVMAVVEREVKRDFSVATEFICDLLRGAGLDYYAHDTVKRMVIDARKRNAPTLEDVRHPKYKQKFDWRRHPGDTREKCMAYLCNQLYRNKYQSANDLRQLVDGAGMKLDIADSTFAIWVADARKQTGQHVTMQEIALLGGKKMRKGTRQNRNPTPKIDIEAPPPQPGQISVHAAKKLAADLIAEAVTTAGKRPVNGDQDARYCGTRAPSFDVRYSQAWLQTPSATAMWCDLLDVDADFLAAWSRKKHGVPRFSSQEIRTFRRKNAERMELANAD